MASPVIMPRQGQSVESCILIEWIKKKGDRVVQGDILFSYETDKASFEEEAKENGILLDVFCEEGVEVPVLTTIAVLGNEGEDVSGFQSQPIKNTHPVTNHDDTPIPAVPAAVVVPAEQDSPKYTISPRARKAAEKLSIAISSIKGTGPGGRIIERDIHQHAEQAPQEYVVEKISHIRRIISRKMHESLQNTAQLTLHTSADARKLLSLRKSIKKHMSTGMVPNITINVLVCFAVIKVLLHHKAIHAHFLPDEIKYFNTVHLGVAIDTERGLMVPTVRNAERLHLRELTEHIRVVREHCQAGSIDPELLHGATFTVTNLGTHGIEMFTPILNPPQVGVLGINAITARPCITEDGDTEFIPSIGLSLTFDHRALDGAPAAAFLHDLSEFIKRIDLEIMRSVI